MITLRFQFQTCLKGHTFCESNTNKCGGNKTPINLSVYLLRPENGARSCYHTGQIKNGSLYWYGSKFGPCPFGPPRRNRWIQVSLEVRDSLAYLYLDGVHVTTVKGHLPTRGHAGVMLSNHEGNIIHFKDFQITELQAFPFSSKSCEAVIEHKDYHSLIIGADLWPDGLCRVFMPDTAASNDYILSTHLFSESGWTGDKIALPGVLFNARDINNFDFVYLR